MIRREAIEKFGEQACWFGILVLAISLPLSRFGTGLGQFIIAGGWLLSGNLIIRFKRAFQNPMVLMLWGFYALHLIGLLWTKNFDFAFNDLRIKLPLFLMPLFISTIPPLTAKQFRSLFLLFVAATFASTMACLFVYFSWEDVNAHDIREISPFVSHIRLSLMVCFSLIISLWYIFKTKNVLLKISLVIISAWFVYFLFFLESITGISILLIGGIFLLLRLMIVNTTSKFLRISGGVLALALLATGLYTLNYIYTESTKVVTVDISALPKTTKLGRPYTHFPERQDLENGNLVWINYCQPEMDSAFRARTGKTVFDLDAKKGMLEITLMRYLTSKNLTKDAEGVSALTETDLKNILAGIATINELQESGIKKRIKDIAWEIRVYHFGGDPSGHSLTMRLEFWNAGIHLIKNNFWIGVGTGDIQDEYLLAYDEIKTKLSKEWRFVAHNQYIRIFVLFGLVGFVYFLFFLLYPAIYLIKFRDLLFVSFLFIVLMSMLNEDTLESQTGVTFFALFNCILLFHDYKVISREAKH